MTLPRRFTIIAALCACIALQATTVDARPTRDRSGPPGNNGTVKIAASPSDRSPSNQPHVGCLLDIDFFGYDEGDLWAEHTIMLHPPTGRDKIADGTVFIGEDRARGGRDHDATMTIDLAQALVTSGFEPHERQGWHMKVTVHADGSMGSDVKHKVFWSQCASAAGVTRVAGADTTVRAAGNIARLDDEQARTHVLAAQFTRPGARERRGVTRNESVAPASLAVTAVRALVPMALGLTLLISGLLLGARLRRMKPEAT